MFVKKSDPDISDLIHVYLFLKVVVKIPIRGFRYGFIAPRVFTAVS